LGIGERKEGGLQSCVYPSQTKPFCHPHSWHGCFGPSIISPVTNLPPSPSGDSGHKSGSSISPIMPQLWVQLLYLDHHCVSPSGLLKAMSPLLDQPTQHRPDHQGAQKGKVYRELSSWVLLCRPLWPLIWASHTGKWDRPALFPLIFLSWLERRLFLCKDTWVWFYKLLRVSLSVFHSMTSDHMDICFCHSMTWIQHISVWSMSVCDFLEVNGKNRDEMEALKKGNSNQRGKH
jgi:hypothetical protein